MSKNIINNCLKCILGQSAVVYFHPVFGAKSSTGFRAFAPQTG